MVVPTGEHEGWGWGLRSGLDITEVSLGNGMNWFWGVPDWARFQHPLVFVRMRVGVGKAGLGLCPC